MNQIEPLDKMDHPIMFRLLFVLNLVTECQLFSHSFCHVQCVNFVYLNSIVFPYLFDLIGSSLMIQLNKFYFEDLIN